MVRLPKCGFGKGVDEEIEREIAEKYRNFNHTRPSITPWNSP
jgi:hypothetical protein